MTIKIYWKNPKIIRKTIDITARYVSVRGVIKTNLIQGDEQDEKGS